MKMLVHLFNPETERRDSEEIGASAAREEFLEMKANFVLAGLDAGSAYDRMVELAIRPKSAFGDPHGYGFGSPYLDAQALRGTPARDIDCMNGYSAGHFFSRPLVPCPPGPGA
jgi:hypothetical protein